MRRIIFGAIVIASCLMISCKSTKQSISCQAYTFKEFTLSEALGKMNELGIKYVELYPNQQMTPEDERKTQFQMSAEQQTDLKKMLKEHKIELSSYGVVSPKKEEDWEKLFHFAQEMGIETIVSEPQTKHLDLVDELCKKYKIRLAIHNHPKGTPYWNPDIVLDALKGRSKYMGACTDVGHWTRSGLDATECLKKLEGKVFEVHMKDVTGTTTDHHAIVWGKGVINWEKVFAELKRQNFKGQFVIEHETNWSNPTPDLQQNLLFFTQQ